MLLPNILQFSIPKVVQDILLTYFILFYVSSNQ